MIFSSGFSKISVGGLIGINEDFDQEAQAFHSHFIINTFVIEIIEMVDGNKHGIHLLIQFLIGNQVPGFSLKKKKNTAKKMAGNLFLSG